MSALATLTDNAEQVYIDQTIAANNGRPGALLGILEAVQEHNPHKYLSAEALRYVAAKLDIPLSRIYSVATFYPLFNLQPQGDNTVCICCGTACHTRNSRNLLQSLRLELGLGLDDDEEAGDADKLALTTKDRRFTVRTVACFGQCALAPVQLDDARKVTGTRFQVTQVRGFEKFTEGRPFYEMPGITSRICGICPISHQLASSKACDAIMAVRIPKAAKLLREVVHCGQFVQSHALSFFYLSGPDLLLGMNADPATRNVAGLIDANPELARAGIDLRKFGLQVIEGLCEERVHPSWIVPGGVKTPLQAQTRDRLLGEIPGAIETTTRALTLFRSKLDSFREEIENFGSAPTMYAGLVDRAGNLQLYDGDLCLRNADGEIVEAAIPADDYADYLGEATLPEPYLKAPYYKPLGYPQGIYRVGPLGRLNVAGNCGTPLADGELQEFRQRFGRLPHSAFLYHYARLIEVLYALEHMKSLMTLPEILDRHVRANAGVNALEGVGIIEAPRGTLIHHYKVDENGAILWVNLIVATGHNNIAIGNSVRQVSQHFVKGGRIEEGMLNRVSAVVRAYDPCLSCSTHAFGAPAVSISLLGPDGALLDEIRN